MSVLYIHAEGDPSVAADKAKLRDVQALYQVAEATEGHMPRIVRILTHAKALVVPDAVDRCNAIMERIKTIARLLGLPVLPVQVFHANNRSAAVAAEPQTQQDAARGPNSFATR
jgi:hypothetical protein